MNVLLTSAGRRAYMVKFFKEAVGEKGSVHICNSDDNSVSFLYADKAVVSPLIYSDEYIQFLLDYCKNNRIDILISLFDIDLLVLASHINEFSKIGTTVVVSDQRFISICNDKWKTNEYLSKNGFCVPKTFLRFDDVIEALDNGDLRYPIIVKPRFGCGSIGISVANDEMGLMYHYKNVRTSIKNSYLSYESSQVSSSEMIIYQECLNGQEFGADIINDLSGRFRKTIIRKKLAMRAGETDIAEIVEESALEKALSKLGMMTGHIVNLDVDVFLVNNMPYILEMNARFGGGYPFSHMAGCDLPKAIINWARGDDVPDKMLDAKVGYKGYKELIISSK